MVRQSRMPKTRPHVVIFFGGDDPSHDVSCETAYWACQYIPRDRYNVTPVRILPNGFWQVPQGSLPQQGPIKRMMDSLFSSLRALSPRDGLNRLLQRPAATFFTVLRGRGGDDGSLHGLAHSLQIPTVGSSAKVCQQTADKELCSTRLQDIAPIPHNLSFKAGDTLENVERDIREQLMLPLFMKPLQTETSSGIEYVTAPSEFLSALKRVSRTGDYMVQQKSQGAELSLTLIEDDKGHVVSLPTTVIVPKQAQFYDSLAKRRPGRVGLHTITAEDNPLVEEAEIIARDVYERLGCRDYASFDFVVDDGSVDLLEVNAIPTVTATTPLIGQLAAAGLHPTQFLDKLLRRSISRGL